MRRFGFIAVVGAAVAGATVLLGAGPVRGVAADDPLTVVSVDTSAAPQVRVVVAAPPQLAGVTLDASNVTVAEAGVVRPVGVAALPADQLEVALVIDTSGSMSGAALDAAKAAATALLNQLPAAVPVAVVGFGAQPVLAAARSADRAAQLAAVRGLVAQGNTALYDAVQVGVGQLGGASAGSGATRKFAVVLSDGGDTASRATLDDTVAALVASHVTVFTVELQTRESNPAALARLTAATGGRSVSAAEPGALASVFDGIAKQLVRQYAVTWRAGAGGPIDADVTVAAAGLRASVRVRLDLPAAAVPAGTEPAPSGAVGAPAPASPRATGLAWQLPVGAALVGGALLLVLLLTLGFRTPRSRALGGGRWATAERSIRGLAGKAEGVLDRLVLGPSGPGAALNALLERSGLDLRPGEVVLATALAAGIAGLVVGAVKGLLAGLVAGLAVVVLAWAALAWLDRRRRQRFADQLGDTLQMLSGSLRAGYGLSQAIEVVAREAESPTAEEFRRLTVETRLGRDGDDAMRALADRVRSQDFEWVVESFEIRREVGGDLAEVLDSVGSTIRDRNRVRRQVRALSAEGRLSAMVLFVLPFVLAAITSFLDPEYLGELTGSATGLALIAASGALMAIGGLWLRRLVKPLF